MEADGSLSFLKHTATAPLPEGDPHHVALCSEICVHIVIYAYVFRDLSLFFFLHPKTSILYALLTQVVGFSVDAFWTSPPHPF